MLTDLCIAALLADETLEDEVWALRGRRMISDELAACAWRLIAVCDDGKG